MSSLARVLVALFLALPAGNAAAQGTPGLARAPEGALRPASAASAPRAGTSESTHLDLNRATEAQLLELPGVGPSRARAILAYREANGGFHSVSQLLRIKGFGRAMFKRLRPLLVVGPR